MTMWQQQNELNMKEPLNISTGHWTMFGKNRVMFDEGYFARDAVVRREVRKKNYKLSTS